MKRIITVAVIALTLTVTQCQEQKPSHNPPKITCQSPVPHQQQLCVYPPNNAQG